MWRNMGRWITGETDTKPELYYDDGNNTDPGVDVHGAPRGTGMYYSARFSCVPFGAVTAICSGQPALILAMTVA